MEKKVKTGISGLDYLLKGGFLRGRSILLSGPCGSGKSILGMQFIYNGVVKYNESGLYVSFEEEKNRIIENMQTIGLNLKKLEKKKKFVLIGGALGSIGHFMDRVKANPDDMINEIVEVVEENKIKRAVVDSVSLFTMLAKDEHERRKILTKLSNALASSGCTSLLISETKEGTMDISRYGMEEFIVDGVIALFQIRQGDRFVPGIVIRKLRGSSHDKNIRLFNITNKGIVVYPKETLFTEI
ncbi:MAG: ATPase domain-containing protein [Nanoarchaeota archaeon]